MVQIFEKIKFIELTGIQSRSSLNSSFQTGAEVG